MSQLNLRGGTMHANMDFSQSSTCTLPALSHLETSPQALYRVGLACERLT